MPEGWDGLQGEERPKNSSPYVKIAEGLEEDLRNEILNYEGMKFRSKDDHGNWRNLQAKFPEGFADFVETLAERKDMPFGNRSNFVRCAVHLLVAICNMTPEGQPIPTVTEYLAAEAYDRQVLYRENALSKIKEYENCLMDYRSAPEDQNTARYGLQQYTNSPNSVVREEAKRALDRE